MNAPEFEDRKALLQFLKACSVYGKFGGRLKAIWDCAYTGGFAQANEAVARFWKTLTKRQKETILAGFAVNRLESK